jgi:DNA mismatch repair protein MutS
LKQLEEKHVDEESGSQESPEVRKSGKLEQNIKKLSTPQMQLSIFDIHSQTFETIRELLSAIDINRLTPVEALMKLNEIKKMIQ